MPDLNNWQETQLSQQHWLTKNIAVRQGKTEELQHRGTLSSLGLSQRVSELLEESHLVTR